MNILVIAPHPDDEVLGCGGTIAKYAKKGDNVSVCFVTKAYTPDWSEEYITNRTVEIKDAHNVLGVEKSYELDFPTGKLDTIPQKTLNDALEKVILEVNPEVVYIPHGGDLHMDHTLVYQAALVATRPHANEINTILCYETVSETEWGANENLFKANVYEDINEFTDTKLKAMEAYRSELKDSPHPRSLKVLSALAVKRGSEAGLKSAEAFMLIREVSRNK